MNITKGCSTQPNRCRHVTQPALHQYYICRIHCNIGSRSDGNSKICPGQCRCIIDSISDHGNLTLTFQVSDHLFFSIREDSGDDLIHTSLCTDCSCGPLIVSGQHHHMDSHIFQFADGLRAVFFDHIRHADNPLKNPVFCKCKRGLSCFCQSSCCLFQFLRKYCLRLHKRNTSTQKGLSLLPSFQAISGKCMELIQLFALYLLLLGFSVDGFCQGMFALFFQLICHFQKFSFGYLCCRNQIRHFRLSACDRSCLIQRNNLYFSCLF